MAVYIYQTPEQVKLSSSVQRRAEILDVRLISTSAGANPKAHEFNKVTARIGHLSKVDSIEPSNLALEIEFALAVSPLDNEELELLTLRCSFRVTYHLDADYQPTKEEANAFASSNAVFNLWAYFREYAQNTCLRMGLPAKPVVPFLKLAPKPDENAHLVDKPANVVRRKRPTDNE